MIQQEIEGTSVSRVQKAGVWMLRQLGAQDTSFPDLVYASRVTQATVGPIIKTGSKILRVSHTSDSN
jgi:3-methyladenine DNA glycosylase AlkD